MQLFKYRGYDAAGGKVTGEMMAASIEEVERRASAQDVTVVAILPAGNGRPSLTVQESTRRRGRASDSDCATLLRDMAVMAESGVPFVEALDALTASARSAHVKNSLKQMKSEVVGGKGISTAFKSCGIFPAVVGDMVKVAEEGGRLDWALSSAATYMERASDLRRKVTNAMIYPIVLTSISFLTVAILIVFVLPRFAEIFSKMKAEVPQSTQALLAFSAAVRQHPFVAVGLVVGFVLLAKFAFSTPSLRRTIAVITLRTPVVGELSKRLALSRSFQSMATLLGSNVALMTALEHGARVAGNPVVSEALMKARVGVEHGAPLSDSLAGAKVFPAMVVQMVQVGEKSGRLGVLMQNLATHMESDVDGRLKALVSIVEPVMIVVMGVIVGGITLSVIIPLYSVVQNIK